MVHIHSTQMMRILCSCESCEGQRSRVNLEISAESSTVDMDFNRLQVFMPDAENHAFQMKKKDVGALITELNELWAQMSGDPEEEVRV